MPVLLVDDDETFAFAVKSMLESCGYEVTVAYSGNEALRMMAAGVNPQIVLLDFVLPDLSGCEVLQKMRERFPEVPVAMVSGYDVDTRPTKVEPTTRVSKPVTKQDLCEIIDRYGLPDPKRTAEFEVPKPK